MIETASYSLFDILGIDVRIDDRLNDLNPGDEVAGKSTVSNNLFEGGI